MAGGLGFVVQEPGAVQGAQVAREEAGTIDTITGTMTAVYADEITLNG